MKEDLAQEMSEVIRLASSYAKHVNTKNRGETTALKEFVGKTYPHEWDPTFPENDNSIESGCEIILVPVRIPKNMVSGIKALGEHFHIDPNTLSKQLAFEMLSDGLLVAVKNTLMNHLKKMGEE